MRKYTMSIITLVIFLMLASFSLAQDNISIEELYLITTRLILCRGNDPVNQGTGFYFFDNNHLFLVTNFHVLTGYNPVESESLKFGTKIYYITQQSETPGRLEQLKLPLESEPLVGDNIIFHIHKNYNNPKDLIEIRLPLFNKKGSPIWFRSKKYSYADVAVIPIPNQFLVDQGVDDVKIMVIGYPIIESHLNVRISSKIVIIGYPYDLYDEKNQLPIWKTGSIASEPNFDFNSEPKFLVDASTFPGMSGSPVFAIASGVFDTVEGKRVEAAVERRFLGIYSSNKILTKTGESLELGTIWKVKTMIDIIENIDLKMYEEEIFKDLEILSK